MTAYSTVTDDTKKTTRIPMRRPSGPPFVRDNLTEKENEILLKNIGEEKLPNHNHEMKVDNAL